jgi:ABC-type glycerol-3-phosphate transport system permease component
VLIFFGAPLLWILSLSLRNQAEVLVGHAQPDPEHPTLDNYSDDPAVRAVPALPAQLAAAVAIGGLIGAMLVAAPRPTRSRGWTSAGARGCCSACSRCR